MIRHTYGLDKACIHCGVVRKKKNYWNNGKTVTVVTYNRNGEVFYQSPFCIVQKIYTA